MTEESARPTTEMLLAQSEWVRALARSLVVDPGTADDVAQDAAVIALTKPPSSASAVRGWFRRVVKNLASNARRGESRRGAREHAVARPESDEAADETVARWEVRRQVVEAVLSLDEPYRSTVLLRFFDGLTAAQAAARQGVPLETVRTRTRRGLELLRGRLAHLDDGKGKRGMAVLLVLARREADLVALGTGAGTGAVAGGVAMASASKWICAAAFLALFGGGLTWAVLTTRDASERHAAAVNPEIRPAVPVKTRRAPPPKDASAPAALDGVDLDSCDRARDLFGVVVDPEGARVANARISALRAKPFASLLLSHDMWDRYATAEETKSGFDGTFALRLAPGDGVALRVDAEGFAIWESVHRQAGERVRVQLSRALALDVRVRTSDGQPVAGAVVRITPQARSTGGDGEFIERGGRTDADGRAAFPRMPCGADVFLTVSPDAEPNAAQTAHLGDALTQTIDVALTPGRELHGIVTDAASGAGIAGAHVSCNFADGDAAVTDASGMFTIVHAPAGSGMAVSATADGYARARTYLRAENSEARLALQPAARLTGRIVDPEGRPVKDADVTAFAHWGPDNAGDSSAGGALSAADGKFAVEGLAPGRAHVLRARAAGRSPHAATVTTPPDAPRSLDVGDIVLGAPHSIRGAVVDADGNPVPRLEVQLGATDRARDEAIRDRRFTDDLGRFAFADLAPGAYAVSAGVGTDRSAIDVDVPKSGDPAPVTIRLGGEAARLKKAVPLRTRVSDEDGNPVAGVQLQAGYAANGATRQIATAADGTVTFSAESEPQSVWINFTKEQERTFLAPRVLLRPGQREVAVVLRRGRTISGKVLDESDRPVWEGGVIAYDGPVRVGHCVTNRDGEFALAVPAGRPVDLSAEPRGEPGVLSRAVGEVRDVAPGADGVVIRVVREPAQRTIDVTVVDESGAPIAGAAVFALYAGWDMQKPDMGRVAADGHVGIPGIPRGPVTLSVQIADAARGPNRYWGPLPVRVPASTDSVRVVVGKPRVLRGRIVREDGSPCGGAMIYVNSVGAIYGGSMDVAETDGRFEVKVAADAPTPYGVHGSPLPFDPKNPQVGWDLVEAEDREYEIVVHPVPAR